MPPGAQSDELQVTLKFSFDEAANTVTLTAESTGYIFGLQAGTRYCNIFKNGNLLRKGGLFMAERLAYDVSTDPSYSYRLIKATRKSIGKYKPRQKHYFHRWVASDDMDLRTAKTALQAKKLVQVFSLAPGQTKATIHLRDLFTMEHKGTRPRQWKKMLMTQYHDFNLSYRLTIERNSCFGKEGEVELMREKVNQLQKHLTKLQEDYPANEDLYPAAYETFVTRRDSLITTFPLIKQTSQCPDLQTAYDDYNNLASQLIQLHRNLHVAPSQTGEVIGSLLKTKHLDANALQFKVRQLDELIGQWLLTTDKNERMNLRMQCKRIIYEANRLAEGKKVENETQRRALLNFSQAYDYYKRTIK